MGPYETGGAGLRVHTAEGDAALEIVRHATELRADLLVMGTHGRSGFDRFTLGSVTEKVLRKAPCPVLTLPPGAASTPLDVAYRQLVCPTDFSSSSDRGIDVALSFARNANARVTVLHVVEGPDEDGEPVQPDRIDAGRRALHAFLAAHAGAVGHAEELVAVGKPHQEILRVAAEQQADLIVIGVRGRGAVDVTLFGSTTNQVVRRAACPVLTMRSEESVS